MSIKEFFKPDWRKVLLSIVFIEVIILFSSCFISHLLEPEPIATGLDIKIGAPFTFYSYRIFSPIGITTMTGIEPEISEIFHFSYFFLNLILWYAISCLIVFIYNRESLRKDVFAGLIIGAVVGIILALPLEVLFPFSRIEEGLRTGMILYVPFLTIVYGAVSLFLGYNIAGCVFGNIFAFSMLWATYGSLIGLLRKLLRGKSNIIKIIVIVLFVAVGIFVNFYLFATGT